MCAFLHAYYCNILGIENNTFTKFTFLIVSLINKVSLNSGVVEAAITNFTE